MACGHRRAKVQAAMSLHDFGKTSINSERIFRLVSPPLHLEALYYFLTAGNLPFQDFLELERKGKRDSLPLVIGQSSPPDALQRYLVGRVPGAKMSIPFEATVGQVKVYYQRSKKYGLGQADCWLDDDSKAYYGSLQF
jgi:hypothetical protein